MAGGIGNCKDSKHLFMGGIGEFNIIIALGVLLAAGFAGVWLVRLLHLPSVTGYILVGILLGPNGLNVIRAEMLESRLQIFTSIALLLIAFSIGERFEIRQLRRSARAVTRVSLGESLGSFVLVALVVGLVAWLTGTGGAHAGPALWVSVALICAAIAVATAPATTIAVFRELGASGPLSRLALSSVVVNNALSVTLFGLVVAAVKVLLGTSAGGGWMQGVLPLANTVLSLAAGFGIGIATDLIVHKLTHRDDVLVVALAAVFFTGGFASFVGLSPLLAGIAAGFAVVNRDRRDVRAFRALNDFEPPLYGLFFALAGAELHLGELLAAGALGIAFVLARATGKYLGAWLGARSADLPRQQSSLIGLALLPQAGLAIGLAYLVRQDPALEVVRTMIIDIVLTSVVINELIGAPLVRYVAVASGETVASAGEIVAVGSPRERADGHGIVPWTWPKLKPPAQPAGCVIAVLANPYTAAGIVRIATLLAHHYQAYPLALHVAAPEPTADDFWGDRARTQEQRLFEIGQREAERLGYRLPSESESAEEIWPEILQATENHNARAIVLGHPGAEQAPQFCQAVDAFAREALCPVVALRLAGELHTERILVPISEPDDFTVVYPMVRALAMVMEHRITVLGLMPPDTPQSDLDVSEDYLIGWEQCQELPGEAVYSAVATESRVHHILQAAQDHDIVVMATGMRSGLRRLFFGSLAEDVAMRIDRPMIIMRGGMESETLREGV